MQELQADFKNSASAEQVRRMHEWVDWVLGAFGVVIGALMWFVKSKMNGYDQKHKQHYEDAKAMSATAQKLDDHIQQDRQQFTEIKEGLHVIQTDIKTLIRGTARP